MTGRKLSGRSKPTGIGAVDDIHVMIAGHQAQPTAELGAAAQQVDKFGPFGAGPGVGDISCHYHAIDRAGAMYRA